MNLEEMSLQELKAVAFDIHQDIARLQSNLQIVLAKIEQSTSVEKFDNDK